MTLYSPAQSVVSPVENMHIGIDPAYSTRPNSLTMIAGGTEMLRVEPDGFWVRGEKVPADEKEAETVYLAFKQFLVWAEMNRR